MADRIQPRRLGEAPPAVAPARDEPFSTIRVDGDANISLDDLVRVLRDRGLLDASGSRRPVAVSFAHESPLAPASARVADTGFFPWYDPEVIVLVEQLPLPVQHALIRYVLNSIIPIIGQAMREGGAFWSEYLRSIDPFYQAVLHWRSELAYNRINTSQVTAELIRAFPSLRAHDEFLAQRLQTQSPKSPKPVDSNHSLFRVSSDTSQASSGVAVSFGRGSPRIWGAKIEFLKTFLKTQPAMTAVVAVDALHIQEFLEILNVEFDSRERERIRLVLLKPTAYSEYDKVEWLADQVRFGFVNGRELAMMVAAGSIALHPILGMGLLDFTSARPFVVDEANFPEGGQVLVGDETALVGLNFPSQHSSGEKQRIANALGRRVFFVGDEVRGLPVYHIDLFLMPLPGREVAAANFAEGYRLLKSMTGEELARVRLQYMASLEKYSSYLGNPVGEEAHLLLFLLDAVANKDAGNPLILLLDRWVSQLQRNIDRETAKLKATGHRIVSVPAIPFIVSSGGFSPLNGLQVQATKGAKTIYLPSFDGGGRFDQAVTQAFRGSRYSGSLHFLSAQQGLMFYETGGPHCYVATIPQVRLNSSSRFLTNPRELQEIAAHARDLPVDFLDVSVSDTLLVDDVGLQAVDQAFIDLARLLQGRTGRDVTVDTSQQQVAYWIHSWAMELFEVSGETTLIRDSQYWAPLVLMIMAYHSRLEDREFLAYGLFAALKNMEALYPNEITVRLKPLPEGNPPGTPASQGNPDGSVGAHGRAPNHTGVMNHAPATDLRSLLLQHGFDPDDYADLLDLADESGRGNPQWLPVNGQAQGPAPTLVEQAIALLSRTDIDPDQMQMDLQDLMNESVGAGSKPAQWGAVCSAPTNRMARQPMAARLMREI
ncbi:MAG: hypothetical protein A3G32_02150 [Deltaproteobacteria bacterium RIFCSPLOWO2_12_FULL_40_28]|nr:MAG: hypothetical protein A3C45_04455 [Deltaproteobacteria bacterium RIFCSPHIGHO2_02_FULL_40_28]OGQ21133.1 MAG: hypothetical protein A3E27_05215 [Deltaproteobacteria bacterium RIFCSPHIGHO2_12_FULL_40_32]OGQ39050.1 MAG: hypothetical protein A3I69_06880 [Deltaproteobacteria bacterium RIFCSPLOWO2_02_FULL_40_36]OGQ53097.1 MAG: hypothetical protein A3G32_02150 [Deltaproteobacteria bacterium RIFCSPLOWO2_12_FULL_40_28]